MKKILFLLLILLISLIYVSPVGASAVIPIKSEGIMKYDIGDKYTGTYGLKPWGHAVYFPNSDPIIIDGIQIQGVKFGELPGFVTIEIWDDNLNTLSQDLVPYDKIPLKTTSIPDECNLELEWVTIPISPHRVTGNFYLVVFTDSYNFDLTKHGIYLGYVIPSISGSSHTVLSLPNNRFDEIRIGSGFLTSSIDWMIRVLYSPAPVTNYTTVSTTIPTTNAERKQSYEKWQTAFNSLEQGKCSMALDYANQAINLYDSWAPPWNVKGGALKCLGRYQEAIDAYDKAISLDPTWDTPKKNKENALFHLQSEGEVNSTKTTMPVTTTVAPADQITSQSTVTPSIPTVTKSPLQISGPILVICLGLYLFKNRI